MQAIRIPDEHWGKVWRALVASGPTPPPIAAPERETQARGAFRFFPDGSSTGVDVRLALAGREAKICVDWFTGRARLAADC